MILTKTKNHNTGFTLVELLVYVGSMAVVLAAVIYMIVSAYSLYSSMILSARADRAAGTLMQVLATELRTGDSIDQGNSVFNSAQGQLAINAIDNGIETDKLFSLDDQRIVFAEDGVETLMTPEDIAVTKFLFTQIVTPVSYAVRYEIDLSYVVDGETVTNTYPGLVVLRHSYE